MTNYAVEVLIKRTLFTFRLATWLIHHHSSSTLRQTDLLTLHYASEIVESIMQLNKEGGINDVSRKFLILCKNHVSYYLKELFNFCIDSLVFPNVFKIAQITPIHKKGSLRNISNYRPVSVLNNLSKVFENLLYNRLQSFCHASDFLAKNQFGFRKHCNTEFVLSILTNFSNVKQLRGILIGVSLSTFGLAVGILFPWHGSC